MTTATGIFAADEQTDLEVDIERWCRLAAMVVAAERVPDDAELSLVFVDERAMTDLNQRFLGNDRPTDVLAFPMDDEPAAGGRQPDQGGSGPGASTEPTGAPPLLGDVVVCPAVAARQAAERGLRVDEEIALLVVHGILHLCEYDHAEPDDAARMQRREQELLERFGAIERGS